MMAWVSVTMSGIISGMNYGLLFSGAPVNTSDAILGALYGNSSSSVPTTTFVSTGNPLTDLKIVQKNKTADVAKEALQPQVSAVINAFKKAVASSTSIQSALANPNVQQVLLTANGLANMIGQTALVRKAFMSNPNDSSSLANQMGNGSLMSAVQTYNFAKNGLAELKNPKVISALSNGYAEVMWRQGLDQATPGLSNALAFLGQANKIKSVSDIMDNPINFFVLTGALGIPTDIAFQDQAAQKSQIMARLNIAKLQNPAYVTQLTNQYLVSQQSNGVSSAAATQTGGFLA